jgi:hypothetical protein
MERIQNGQSTGKEMEVLLDVPVEGEEDEESKRRRREFRFGVLFVRSQRAAVLRHMNRLVEIAKLPDQLQHVKMQQIDTKDQPIFVRICCGAYARLTGILHGRATLQCAVAGIAAERFRSDNKRWPNSLEEMVPKYLASVPLDPFGPPGQPLALKASPQGIAISSVGREDIEDDSAEQPQDLNKDVRFPRFRLYCAEQRRQPSRPFQLISDLADVVDLFADPVPAEKRHAAALLRCTAIAEALVRFRLTNNRWPESLSELTDQYLRLWRVDDRQVDTWPIDPFDGQPLHYRRIEGGVVVYSVGSDEADDGGKIDRTPGEKGADIGIRIWDFSTRK